MSKRKAAMINPRPPGETRICLRCARWGARAPSSDCVHPAGQIASVEGATTAELDELDDIAEHAAQARSAAAVNLGGLAACVLFVSRRRPAPSNVVRLDERREAAARRFVAVAGGPKGGHPVDGRAS